jgi:alcohol dehydrogenase
MPTPTTTLENSSTATSGPTTMWALQYGGPHITKWAEVPTPQIHDTTDTIVRVDMTTICGSDVHILKGDVPEVTVGRILGHEAVGTVEEIGTGVRGPQGR